MSEVKENVQGENSSQNNQSKETKKIVDAFSKAMEGLSTIFQGEGNIKPVKQLNSSSVPTLMQEVYKEEEEALAKRFKDGAKALMVAKIAYDRCIKQQEAEMQKAKNKKMKEFTQEANKLVGLIAQISELPQHYANALNPEGTSQEPSTDGEE